ncbi:HK97 family phage major capsid protein [Rhizobium sp. PP-F2F-G48]|uniref:phage major capsid protein n=1 Tax=Rhizobium sp. PP-F2F-G48 TaxID=2135651 RepID=UPI00104753DB|nr:phage major capsid protein [Rhizobium sp. PP-F2F-G48]TCM56161.1 HK97 family phage major capsid protein [Rhizobium sp. PP-F2F-G48]
MLKQLREKRAKLVADMRGMVTAAETEDRDFSAEEMTSYDALEAEKAGLDQRIARLENLDATTAALDAVVPAAARGQGIQRAGGAEASREFESMGEFLHAVRFRPNDQRLNYVENAGASDNGEVRSEMRMDDGASGGFMVPTQLRSTLLTLTPQQSIIRPRATVIEAGSPPDAAVTMPALDQSGAAPANMFGGVEVKWIGEGDTKPNTDLRLREITLTPHEIAGTMVVTDKLLRNWPAANSLLEAQLRGAVAQSEDYAYLQGNGVGKPLGILKAGATLKVNRAVANQISYDDVANMVGRGYGNGVFVYSRSALVFLLKLKDLGGNPIWVPSMREGEPSTLMGRPAILSDRNPLLGSLGDIWYGDLSQYLIKDGSGPFVAASEHVLFQQNKTMIKIFWNVDGSPWLTAPFQLENGYLTSPFVALDVPSV